MERERAKTRRNLLQSVVKFWNTDYFKMLGLSRNATDVEVKAAYKKMALELHPDKQTGPNNVFAEAFKAIAKAFKVLGNEKSRESYIFNGHADRWLTPTSPLKPPELLEAGVDFLSLEWGRQLEEDDFILQINDSDNDDNFSTLYKGQDTQYRCNNLLRYTSYRFRLGVPDEKGGYSWSHEATFSTLPGRPSKPPRPYVVDNHKIKWDPPADTGGPQIGEYILECRKECTSGGYKEVYRGPSREFRLVNLDHDSTYLFRISCQSEGGRSPASEPRSLRTKPKPRPIPLKWKPGRVSDVRCSPTHSSLRLHWDPAPFHGEDVTHYTVNVSPLREAWDIPETYFTVKDLKPNSSFKVRVRAVNILGIGPWSPILETATLTLPPSPPIIKLMHVAPTSLTLKWFYQTPTNGNAKLMRYSLVMQNPKKLDVDTKLYSGAKDTFKVTRLKEQTSYKFAISAENDAGKGSFSEYYDFSTSTVPPSILKAPRISEIASDGCTVEWTAAKPMGENLDPMSYCLQISHVRDQEFDQVYCGDENKTTMRGLKPNTDYRVRVCAIRRAPKCKLHGPFSSATSFYTLKQTVNSKDSEISKQAELVQENFWHRACDRQRAAILLSAFLVLSLIFAYFIIEILQ